MRSHWLSLIILLGTAGIAAADVVELKDGTTLTGDVKREDRRWLITLQDGTVRRISADDVKSVNVSGATSRPVIEATQASLNALHRQVESTTQPSEAISKYDKFLARPSEPAIMEQAREELAVWVDRRDRKLVRIGDNWLTPEQVRESRQRIMPRIDEARQLLDEGRISRAEQIIEEVLAIDPANISAMYLKGIVHFEKRQFPIARQSFEQVRNALPDHPATWNNIGVILFEQNQETPGLAAYEKALAYGANEPKILDNVAEALASLSDDERRSTVAKRVMQRFQEADKAVAAELAGQDLYRWGATWVSGEQIRQIEQERKTIEQKIDDLEDQFAEIEDEIELINARIHNNRQRMVRLRIDTERRQEQYKGPGRIGLPREYQMLAGENEELQLEQNQKQRKLEDMREEAHQLKAKYPQPQYSGRQRLIGPEGTPVLMTDAMGAPPTAATE